MPPFIPNADIERELSRFGRLAGAIRMIPLGCKNANLKHVLSFRRQVFMFLNTPSLNVSFRCLHEGRSYMVYASTGELRCFGCGNVGHVRMNCPNATVEEIGVPRQAGGEDGATSGNEDQSGEGKATSGNNSEVEDGGGSRPQSGAGESTGNAVSVLGGEEPVVCEQTVSSADVDESQGVAANAESSAAVQYGEPHGPKSPDKLMQSEEEMVDDDTMSEMSDVSEISQINQEQLYPLEDISKFLDDTYGKAVEVEEFFPDIEKFEASVVFWKRKVGLDELSKKKRYRLKKLITKIRKVKALNKSKN